MNQLRPHSLQDQSLEKLLKATAEQKHTTVHNNHDSGDYSRRSNAELHNIAESSRNPSDCEQTLLKVNKSSPLKEELQLVEDNLTRTENELFFPLPGMYLLARKKLSLVNMWLKLLHYWALT